MGTSRFYREHASLMRAGTAADHAQRVQDAYEAVRDRWIAERRFSELVRAITANWTSGNCVDFMAPLSEALAASGEVELHRHLWSRTIKRQVETFFRVLGSVQGTPAYLRLRNLDTTGFVETDPASYARPERAAAFLFQRLCRDLDRWRDELAAAGLSTDEVGRIEHCLRLLKPPRIRVNPLPRAAG